MGHLKHSVHRQLRENGCKSVKRLITLQATDGAIQRWLERSQQFLIWFLIWKVKKLIFADEKDFTLQVPSKQKYNRLCTKVKKNEVFATRVYQQENKQSLKLICFWWIVMKLVLLIIFSGNLIKQK